MDIAALPIRLCMIRNDCTAYSTAFCVTAFGIRLNMERTVLASILHSVSTRQTLRSENVRIQVVARHRRGDESDRKPVKPHTEKGRDAEEAPRRSRDHGKGPENAAVGLPNTLRMLVMSLVWRKDVRLFKAEGRGQAVRRSDRPPSQAGKVATAEILHHVEVEGVHENHNHRLNDGIGHEQSSEEIEKHSDNLLLVHIAKALP